MNEKMNLVLEGIVKVYEDDNKIINTFHKVFEFSDDLPSNEKIIKAIEDIRKKNDK